MSRPWTNPRPADRYELVVVGGDSLAVLAAEQAAAAGRRVAIASDHPLALDALAAAPRAALFQAAECRRLAELARSRGWPRATLGEFDFDLWRQAGQRLSEETRRRFSAQRLQSLGIDVHLGPMNFQSRDTVRVAGQSLSFTRAIVAPPANWAPLALPGFAELDCQTPDSLDRLTSWPRRWAIVGGGALACELAQSLALLGASVELVTPAAALLSGTPLDIGADATVPIGERPAALVARRLAEDGVRVRTGCVIVEAARTGAAKSLLIEHEGGPQKLLADEILVVTQRAFDVDWLRLEAAGVAFEQGDIASAADLRTANRAIVGVPARTLPDVSNAEFLAALASLAVATALGPSSRTASAIMAPQRLRFDPPIAWVGDVASLRLRVEASRASWPGAKAPDDWAIAEAERQFEAPRTPVDSVAVERASVNEPRHEPAPERPSELWLSMQGRRLVGAIVIGLQAQDLVGALTQAIAAPGPQGGIFAGRPDLAWLERIVAGTNRASDLREPRWWWRWTGRRKRAIT